MYGNMLAFLMIGNNLFGAIEFPFAKWRRAKKRVSVLEECCGQVW
jgi:hypothetical protein